MGKMISREAILAMINMAAFCYYRDFIDTHNYEPSPHDVEKHAKARVVEYCDIEGIQYIEED